MFRGTFNKLFLAYLKDLGVEEGELFDIYTGIGRGLEGTYAVDYAGKSVHNLEGEEVLRSGRLYASCSCGKRNFKVKRVGN